MFKPPRTASSLRAFSTFPRLRATYRPSVLNQNGDVRIQRVHVKEGRSKKSSKRVFLQAAIWVFIWHFILDSPFIDTPWKKAAAEEREAEERAAKRLKDSKKVEPESVDGEDSKKTEEEDVDVPAEMPEDALFIPLGIARQKPQTFYKGTDPEWQSFVDFSKDRKRSQLIRNELAGLIGRHLSGMKNFQKQLGQPIQTRKFWLDIDFPDGPPPEYERSGIEIADEYIAWTTRPVDAIQVSRLKAALWPQPVAVSLWSSYSTLWSLQLARAKQFLGIKSEVNPPNISTTDIVDFQKLAKANDKQNSQTGTGFEQDEETTNTDPALPPPPPPKAASAEDPSKMSGAKQRLHNLGVLGAMQDFGTALHVFQHSLIRTWKMPQAAPERGTLMVSGLVEVVGSKATCVVDVRAAYHPKENRWVAIGVGVRRLQAKKQAPRGGS